MYKRQPLPSVAVNDPLFRNVTTNDWSGQAEALTYQRAIRALENYGYDSLIPELGEKLFQAIGEDCIFVQQYDPFTAAPSLVDVYKRQPCCTELAQGVRSITCPTERCSVTRRQGR